MIACPVCLTSPRAYARIQSDDYCVCDCGRLEHFEDLGMWTMLVGTMERLVMYKTGIPSVWANHVGHVVPDAEAWTVVTQAIHRLLASEVMAS
jgi:hypothetical protein